MFYSLAFLWPTTKLGYYYPHEGNHPDKHPFLCHWYDTEEVSVIWVYNILHTCHTFRWKFLGARLISVSILTLMCLCIGNVWTKMLSNQIFFRELRLTFWALLCARSTCEICNVWIRRWATFCVAQCFTSGLHCYTDHLSVCLSMRGLFVS